jgi:DNA-binding NarL/FixJ family response regulator
MIKVAIVDDELMPREWLPGMAGGDGAMTVVGATTSVSALMGILDEPPNVVVLDVILNDGTKLADNVDKLIAWGSRVVVFSKDERSHAMRRVALRHGALAFVVKTGGFDETRAAIMSAAEGRHLIDERTAEFILIEQVPLTPAQRKVAYHLAAGLSNIEIAEMQSLSRDTVKEHVQEIRKALAKAERPAGSRSDVENSLREDGIQDEW